MAVTSLLGEFNPPEKNLSSIGFLPDGQLHIVFPYSERIWIWDPFIKSNKTTELDHSDEVWSLSFDRSGHKLVSTGDDNKIRLWDLNSKENRVIGNASSLVPRGRFSRDESLYAACDFSGFVYIWETKDWSLLKKIQVGTHRIRSLAWGKNNDFLVCVGNGNIISELNLEDFSIKKYPLDATCFDVCYSDLTDEFLVSQQDAKHRLLFMTFPGGIIRSRLSSGFLPTRMAIDPTSDRVAVGFDEGGFGIISTKNRELLRKVGTERSDGAVIDIVFTNDGRNVITSVRNKRAIIYDTITWEKVGFIDSPNADTHALAFSADGKMFATGDMAGKIKLFKVPQQNLCK